MLAFILEHIVEILFGLISAGALAFCKHMNTQMKDYKRLLEEKQQERIEEIVKEQMQPVIDDLEELKGEIEKIGETEHGHIELILTSYRFRLLQLCKQVIQQGYMTQSQYDQLTEFFKLYHELGGNGQAQDYYDKAMSLEVRPN